MGRVQPTRRWPRAARLGLATWFAFFNIAIHGLHTCRFAAALFEQPCGDCCGAGPDSGCHSGASFAAGGGFAAWTPLSVHCPACHYLLGCPEAGSPDASGVFPDGAELERVGAHPALSLSTAQYPPSRPRAPPVAS